MKYIIYCDGACSGNPGPGGWAVLVFDKYLWKVVGGYEPSTTNNQMELRAAIEGLKLVPPGAAVEIKTDSQYLIQGITSWLPNWKKKNWKTAGKKEVKNIELWKMLDHLNHSNVTWTYVAGHQGLLYNEICDKLARLYIQKEGKLSSVDLKEEFEKLYWKLIKSQKVKPFAKNEL